MSKSLKRGSFLRCVARCLGGNQGSSLVEYAIVLVVLLTIIFGIMDFSRFLYAYHFVSEAAREGSRYAMVRGYTYHGTTCASTTPPTPSFACNATNTNVQSYVQGLAPPTITSGSLTVTTTWPGTVPSGAAASCASATSKESHGCLVEVEVSYPFKFIFPYLSTSTFTMTSTSEVSITE